MNAVTGLWQTLRTPVTYSQESGFGNLFTGSNMRSQERKRRIRQVDTRKFRSEPPSLLHCARSHLLIATHVPEI